MPDPTPTPDIEIFRTGTHTAMSGETVTVSPSELQAIADRYSLATDQAPIVIGHPTTNGPAYGWVTGLRVEGDRLVATAGQVDPAFAELVRAGRYKKVSASFKSTHGGWSLRHVGFLGAVPPAVKGLKEAVFGDPDPAPAPALMFEFCSCKQEDDRKMDPDTLKKLEAELAASRTALAASEAEKKALAASVASFAERARAQRQAADAVRIDALVASGKVLPAEAGRVKVLTHSLDGITAPIEFSEGTGGTVLKVSAKDMLFSLLEAREKLVEFREITPNTTMGGAIDFADPVAIADAAAAHQADMARRGTPCSSTDAVLKVMKGVRS